MFRINQMLKYRLNLPFFNFEYLSILDYFMAVKLSFYQITKSGILQLLLNLTLSTDFDEIKYFIYYIYINI